MPRNKAFGQEEKPKWYPTRRTSSRLIGPLSLGNGYYLLSFSEVVTFDSASSGEDWVRADLIIQNSGDFPIKMNTLVRLDAVEQIQIIAWPCSISGYSGEDNGWAIDDWDYTLHEHGDGEKPGFYTIQIRIGVAIRGTSARFNRIGYKWTAYLSDLKE